jgi:hypothetical protein
MIRKGDVETWLRETWLREHPIGRVVESVTRSCPPVELVAPLVRTMVYARLSSHTAWEACRGLRHSSQDERLGL